MRRLYSGWMPSSGILNKALSARKKLLRCLGADMRVPKCELKGEPVASGGRRKLQPASPIFSAVPCDICGKVLPAGTPVICMPSHDGNFDPWACVPCVSADPSYEIAANWDEYINPRGQRLVAA